MKKQCKGDSNMGEWSGWLNPLPWEHSSPWIKYKFTIVTLLWHAIDIALTLMLPSPQCFLFHNLSSPPYVLSTMLIVQNDCYCPQCLWSTIIVIVHNVYCPQCFHGELDFVSYVNFSLPLWTILLQQIVLLASANNNYDWVINTAIANGAETAM